MQVMGISAHRTNPPPVRGHFTSRSFLGLGSGLGLALGLTGCTAIMRTDVFNGSCGPEHERCVAACEEIRERQERNMCIDRCQIDSRACAARQRERPDETIGINLEHRRVVTDLTEPVTQSVDFSAGRIQSSGASVNAQGEVRQAGDVFELMPGGILTIAFTLPPDAREAELLLEHGAGGGGTPCFVTVSLGEKAILGRYSAPRRGFDGVLKPERFNVTPNLPPPVGKESAARPFTLVVYNNAEAQSQAPYFVRRITLTTREKLP